MVTYSSVLSAVHCRLRRTLMPHCSTEGRVQGVDSLGGWNVPSLACNNITLQLEPLFHSPSTS